MSLKRLRASLDALGYRAIQTYMQSGNAVFCADERRALPISRDIERQIQQDFLYSVDVITRRRRELARTIELNPFLKNIGVEHARLDVLFLPAAPDEAVREELKRLTRRPDESWLLGKDLDLSALYQLALDLR
jgi:uncharacterized protein (DUF1697 family)